MAVNNLTFEQSAAVLNAVVQQATGKSTLAATNTSDFVSVAQTALKTGYDTVLGAISQVLSRTIFSVRPYNRMFRGLEADNQRYGAIVRKLTSIDLDYVDDERYNPTDGETVDMYTIRKPKVLQTNFYGGTPFQSFVTIFGEQLDQAFRNAEEFGAFISMVMGNMSDHLEQGRESMARATLANAIGGKIAKNENVIHLLTEYNAATGLELTATTVYQPENFAPFMRWVYARIANISTLMEQRSSLFHTNITDKTIMRHTPAEYQRIYISAEGKTQMDAQVLSTTFNDKRLSLADWEGVAYWQNINNPTSINVKPSYLANDGTITVPEAAIAKDTVFGVMFDRDAMGYTIINQSVNPTPFNPRGGYYNMFYSETYRWWNDFTENIVVLLLD